MSTYITCIGCNHLSLKGPDKCPSCAKTFSWAVKASNNSHAIHIFRTGFYEHIAADPIYIHGRKQLIDETVSRELTSHYIQ